MRMERGDLGRRIIEDMHGITHDRHTGLVLENARRNAALRDRGRSLSALRNQEIGCGDAAIVVAAGPSLARRHPGPLIRDSGFRGAVIATESALVYCLRNGITPDLVVTLDPHPERIVRWFGDPHLTEQRLRTDDYYRRQDLEESFTRELRNNEEVLALLDRHGKNIRLALCTSASQSVVDRVLEIGMDIYWWNPLLDDPTTPESATARLQAMNRLPLVNTGGNVGTASWMMAHAVLGKSHVAVTGMDFGYYADMPYERTQYYHEICRLVGKQNLDQVYMWAYNPDVGAWFYSDPAYMWYRNAFLEFARETDCTTYNCTGGGLLFGDPIKSMPLEQFLANHA